MRKQGRPHQNLGDFGPLKAIPIEFTNANDRNFQYTNHFEKD